MSELVSSTVGAATLATLATDDMDGMGTSMNKLNSARLRERREQGHALGRELRQRGSEGPADRDREPDRDVCFVRAVVADLERRGEDRHGVRGREGEVVLLDGLSREHRTRVTVTLK